MAKKSSYPHSGSLEDGRRIQGEAAGLGVPARVGVSGDRGGDRETSPLQPRAESQAWPWAFACGQKVATRRAPAEGVCQGQMCGGIRLLLWVRRSPIPRAPLCGKPSRLKTTWSCLTARLEKPGLQRLHITGGWAANTMGVTEPLPSRNVTESNKVQKASERRALNGIEGVLSSRSRGLQQIQGS